MENSTNLLQLLCKLLKHFSEENLTAVEYLEQCKIKYASLKENEIEHFLAITKYEDILKDLSEYVIKRYTLRRINKINLKVLIYLIIFYFKEENYDESMEILRQANSYYILKILDYFSNTSNHVLIAHASCKQFDNTYVLENILYPFLTRSPILKKIKFDLEVEVTNKNKPKNTTIPIEPNVMHRIISSIPPPPNTPQHWEKYKAQPVPKSTYKVSKKIKTFLEEEHLKNRAAALKLIEDANEYIKKLAVPKSELKKPDYKVPRYKASKIPPKREVEIKSNITATLREANTYIKEQEKEIKKIEDLLKGGYGREKMELFESERKKMEAKKFVENIERKHLEGLLSYEDAILARKNLFVTNQEKILQFKEEKNKILAELEIWKREEQIKIKSIVDKIQEINKGARDAEKKVQEEKQCNAKMLQYESKQLLKKFYEEKQQELARKIELIKDIRTMEQVRKTMNIKEFDKTESPNFGLLCEMSIAELQGRLTMMKTSMKKELEEKRKYIQSKKEDRERMIENVKNFVAQSKRSLKPKMQPNCPSNLEQNPDLILLRQKLEEKRCLRKSI